MPQAVDRKQGLQHSLDMQLSLVHQLLPDHRFLKHVNGQLGFQRPVHFAFHVETKRKNYDIKHYLTATAKVTNNPTVSSKHEQKSKRLAFEGFVVIITNLACQVSHCSSSTARL